LFRSTLPRSKRRAIYGAEWSNFLDLPYSVYARIDASHMFVLSME